MYLGAKHMITGYDHLLYLVGVIFYLKNFRDVIKLVSLFALGHSITLLLGVLADIHVNPYLIDALIGFSVVYKAYENLGGFQRIGISPSVPNAVFAFGLIHGLGLATKLQEFTISEQGLVTNIISFNIGVEVGQVCALVFILIFFKLFQQWRHFQSSSLYINWGLMVAGFVLVGYQLSGFFLT
ncbi:MAG: HupE/UreJ family protein [Acidiferrobacterales bacterium]|nr:HupE/UreJ family protein [Acidiferrobacterales bacterium]